MPRKDIKKDVVTLQRLDIHWVPVSDLVPNEYNPNRQSEDEFKLLKQSITEDGFTQPILVRETDHVIIDGYHRWKAASELGYTEVPVVYTDMSEAQRRIATIRHNRARGNEDMELMSAMMKDFEKLGALDWAADSLDLSDEEIERLMKYGDTVLDHFPAKEPSVAWQPEQTRPGQVAQWKDPNSGDVQSVSTVAGTPIAGLAPVDTGVPGLGIKQAAALGVPLEVQAAPEMVRRVFVFTAEEANIVDQAIGEYGAQGLLDLCKAKLGMA